MSEEPTATWSKADVMRLHDDGYHLFRIGDNKLPLGKWRRGGQDFVEQRQTDHQVRAWVGTKPPGWCVLCGGPQRLAVIDVESPGMTDDTIKGERIREVIARYPDTCKRQTPSGGLHVWLQVSDGDAPAGGTAQTRCYRFNGTKVSKSGVTIRDTTLLVEMRGHGQYAGMLGFGRGDLPEDWAPHQVTRAELDGVWEYLHEVSDVIPMAKAKRPRSKAERTAEAWERDARDWEAHPPKDTADVLAWAVVEGHLSWLDVLEDGWSAMGATAGGWTLWLRPDYDEEGITSASSANGAELRGIPSLTVHSTSVPWAEAERSYSPASVLAASGYEGNYGKAMAAVEAAAGMQARGTLASSESRFKGWPPVVLNHIYALRRAQGSNRAPWEVANHADFKDELIEQLGVNKLAGLFMRGGEMVHVPRIGERGYVPPPEEEGEDGPAQVHGVSDGLLRYLVEREFYLFEVVKRGEEEYEQHVLMPGVVAKGVVDAAHELPNLRRLRGVVHTPLLRRDGSMLSEPGFDEATGLLYLPDSPVESMTAEEGRGILEEVLGGFPWKHEGDRANFYAALALPFLRLMVPPPWSMWLFNAHQPGSGKTQLATILRHTHGGSHRAALPKDEEEIRKQLTSLLLTTSGQVVVWDNVMGLVNSAQLANLLTSRTRTDRRLGESVDKTMVNDRLMALTGNNIQVGGDLPRRVVWCSVDPGVANPESRVFDALDGELPASWVQRNLPTFRGAVLAVLAEWAAAGMPRGKAVSSDDYRVLSEVMNGLLPYFDAHAGFRHPSTVMATVAVDDEDWGVFFAAIHKQFGDKWFTTRQLASEWDLRKQWPDVMLAKGDRISDTSIGRYLANRVGRYHGGWRIDSTIESATHSKKWRVTHVE